MNKDNIVERVELQLIESSNYYYDKIFLGCAYSGELYNLANDMLKSFILKKEKINKNDFIEKIMQSKKAQRDIEMLTKNISKQIINVCWRDHESYKKNIDNYFENLDYNLKNEIKCPNLPENKNNGFVVFYGKYDFKYKDNVIMLPICDETITLKMKDKGTPIGIDIIPSNKKIIVNIIYETEIDYEKARIASCDIGLRNFLAITNNFYKEPIIIDGLSFYEEYNFEEDKIKEFVDKSISFVLNYCFENKIKYFVLGNILSTKSMMKINSDKKDLFNSYDHINFYKTLKKELERNGTKLILVNEHYTSGTSFLDREIPNKKNYNYSRRNGDIFTSRYGLKINADINGSYQIMRKAFPMMFFDDYYDLDSFKFEPKYIYLIDKIKKL